MLELSEMDGNGVLKGRCKLGSILGDCTSEDKGLLESWREKIDC